MKYLKHLALLALAALVLSCGQPPKAEVDAARAKVAAAQKDADVVSYSADTLEQAKDALARMEKNLADRKYADAKAAAIQAASLADSAKAEVAGAKERAKTEATALIAEAKAQLSPLLATVAKAKAAKPKGLDLAALEKDLASARTKLNDAASALGAGSFATARSLATEVKAAFSELEKRIADAIQLARAKK